MRTITFIQNFLQPVIEVSSTLKTVALLGADIATVNYGMVEQLPNHPVTNTGLDRFLNDWKKAGL